MPVTICLATAAFVAAPGPARADSKADQLFDEGRRLIREGKPEEGCLKMAESYRLEPSPGTLLNLGDCHETQGRTATAWSDFQRARQLARRRGDEEQAAEGRRRALALESKFSYLIICASAQVPGLVVKSNGTTVANAQLCSWTPTDAGEYLITAEAAGYVPYRTKATVATAGLAKVELPPLMPQDRGVVALPSMSDWLPDRPKPGKARPLTGYAVGGLGLAAFGAGGIFGIRGLTSDGRCLGTNCFGLASVGLGLGAIGLGAGSYLLFFVPLKKADFAAGKLTNIVLRPHLTGATISGQF